MKNEIAEKLARKLCPDESIKEYIWNRDKNMLIGNIEEALDEYAESLKSKAANKGQVEQIVTTWTKIAIDEIHEDNRDISIAQNIKLSIRGALDEYAKALKKKRIPDLFHPGEFVKEEMEARGWNLRTLCLEMKMQPPDVQAILDKKFAIGTLEAEALSRAFGTLAQVWLNLQATYNAGIAIERMKAAEELAELVGDAFGGCADKGFENFRFRIKDYSKWVALARKIMKGAKNGGL